ncbi:EthD family reductase [Leucobacter chromiireducens]|uniref:EthD family reductase n=1 Tax=Leucobacter chromiireducens subsp. solipictus TaxID=398235 RepID=A0ABS1SI70_9MICO|nr:EthD family reductase [Leucobacter chromiireducens]MBL3680032.1 EthD family reductase [Leucobacter chromiireducens subsp. solipictus]
MHKLMVLYPEPQDRTAFTAYYESVHLPLCAALPGVQRISYALGISEPGDGPYFGIFEAEFASEAALLAALASPQGRAVETDVPNYATGGAQVLRFPVAEVGLGEHGGPVRSRSTPGPHGATETHRSARGRVPAPTGGSSQPHATRTAESAGGRGTSSRSPVQR